MKTIDIADATASLSDYAAKELKEAVVVTRGGKPVLVVTPIKESDWESIAVATNPTWPSWNARGLLTSLAPASRLRRCVVASA